MIIFDVQQGTTEWAMLRAGVPTASQFQRILTPKTLKLSEQATAYAHELIAEQILGAPLDNATSGFMERGKDWEKSAIAHYALANDVASMKRVGFVLRDDKRVGCSPDHFVDDDGLLEIKVPSAHQHVAYLLDPNGIGYRAQVQGQLWLCERAWCDTLSYNPEMPAALVRQYRDDLFIKALSSAVNQFLEMVDDMKSTLIARGDFPMLSVPDLKVVA